MSAPDWAQVKELLHRAIALDPELRAKFLDEVCASDAALRVELESSLSVGDELSAEFLQSPPQFSGVVGGPDAAVVELGAAGLAAGQLFAERYQLIRRLGEGGMGQVWLAEQTLPVRRLVALKLIRAGMYDEAVVRRFQSERQSLAIMDHPAIAKVFDAGATPQGQPYLVMEYVPGLPITEYCDQHRLKIPERLELFIRACEGVQHAHQKAIIHRDLKPANILIVEVDGEPRPRIIDFGLAKATTVQLTEETLHTRIGQFLGTPGYMSPEQVDPNIQDVDTRADVYSLGVILYVLLTGLQPFETKSREKPPLDVWLRQLREEEPPSPSTKLSSDPDTATATSAARGTEPKQLASEIKGDLDWIAMKALERDRERRYGTPTELAADLRHFLNHEPVTARPASPGYQLAKYIRRHRIATLVTAMVVLLGAITSVAGLVAVRKEHEAEFQAAQAREAQSRALTQAAAQHLGDQDIAVAQGIILEVLTNPALAHARSAAAISISQEIRASDAQLAVLSGHSAPVPSAAYSPDGARIVTASFDKTARIWDARVPASIDAQIIWATSAETDPLSDVDRKELGLPLDSRARSWPTEASACDQATAAFYDPERLAPGASQANINVDIATSSCAAEIVKSGHTARLDYQMGRALRAKGDVNGAKRQFELAVSSGYRAAGIDLADLLVSAAASVPDRERAATLYEMAWRGGVHIAAFELGQLYEYGVQGAEAAGTKPPKQDLRQAWSWYQKGADVGEPNALGRFAERDDANALTQNSLIRKDGLLLQAFAFYATAAQRALSENWPEDAWRNWRYRRATLARLLAREGMMQQVADAYAAILDNVNPPTLHIASVALWSEPPNQCE